MLNPVFACWNLRMSMAERKYEGESFVRSHFRQEPLEMFKCRVIVAHWHVTIAIRCAFDTSKRW